MEKNLIKLGIYRHLENSDSIINLEKLLESEQYKTEIHVYKSKLEETSCNKDLKSKAIDFLAQPLNLTPTSLDQDLAIAALHGRLDARWVLLLNEKHDSLEAFKTQPRFELSVPNDLIANQVKKLFPSLLVTIENSIDSMINSFSDGEKNSILVPYHKTSQSKLEIETFCHFIFEPSELVPTSGEGVTAFITRADEIEKRKLLIPYHNKELALLTNIERKISKAFTASTTLVELGIHCFVNNQNHYQLICCYQDEQGEIKKLYFTQITYVGLAEKVISQLNLD